MDNLEYKGYIGSVEYSKDDDCLCGKVVGMSKGLISYEGRTLEELKADFEAGIDSYLDGCALHGIKPRKSFGGSLNVRLSPEIHSKIALLAEESGVTINAFIKDAVKERLKLSGI